ncbi:MAG TPA: hypothetical protein VN962_24815 [Polyangia bacterium]|nr:hypothetical protein [Polyangia bacterium]
MNQSWNARAHGRKLALGLALSGLTAVIAQGCASSDTPEFILLPDAGVGPGNNSAKGGSTSSGSGGSLGTGGSSGGSFGSGGNSPTGGSVGTGGNRATGGTVGSGGSTGSGGTITGSGGSGSGGTRATGGTTGSGGSGGARATGGSTGSGGSASGGTTGAGGTRATGGTTGSGGSGGVKGTGGSGGSSGTATFTQIYTQILSVSCAGSQCHNPGSQKGISFSSQSTAYSAVKSRVTAGNATGSSFYSTVNSGSMPPTGKLPAAQLQMIADWINAGALNN